MLASAVATKRSLWLFAVFESDPFCLTTIKELESFVLEACRFVCDACRLERY